MIEVGLLLYHINQIFKEPKKAWGISFVCSLPKSFHYAKSTELTELTSKQLGNHLSFMIRKGVTLDMLIELILPTVIRSVVRKKQNP